MASRQTLVSEHVISVERDGIRVASLSLHPGQYEVARTKSRFRVLAAGRRWGKTRLAATLCVLRALKGERTWWVGPSYPMAQVGWGEIRGLARRVGNASVREADHIITFPGGGSVQVRSADNPDSLRGQGLDFVVLDECAFMREEAWTEALRPALSDRQGQALFISTPNGRNWFWRLWQLGQLEAGEWRSWQRPTSDNPYIKPEEIEAARQLLPERVFQQEYMAEFVSDSGGGVFRRVLEAATLTPQEGPLEGHQYVIGVDWGKHHDWTVLSVIDVTTKEQVYQDRFNQIDYALQVGRLRVLYERFRPTAIIAERNSMGEPLIEQLLEEGLPVQPFTTTNATKAAIIEGLVLAFERAELRILNDQVLISELLAYETERLPSGLLRYNAPPGMHDDCVMALALAWSGAETEGEGHMDVEIVEHKLDMPWPLRPRHRYPSQPEKQENVTMTQYWV